MTTLNHNQFIFYYNIKILPNVVIYVYLYRSKKSKYSQGITVLRFVNYENRKTAWFFDTSSQKFIDYHKFNGMVGYNAAADKNSLCQGK